MFAFPEIDYDNHPFYQRYNNTLDKNTIDQVNRKYEARWNAIASEYPKERLKRPTLDDGNIISDIHGELVKSGVVPFECNQGFAKEILPTLNALGDKMVESGFKTQVRYIYPNDPRNEVDPVLLKISNEIMKTTNFLEMGRSYFQNDDIGYKYTLRFTHPGDPQTGIKFFSPHEVPLSETALLHFDYPMNSLKLMIYLNDVKSKDDGAFCYIRKSHRENADWREIIDRQTADTFAIKFDTDLDQFGAFMALQPDRRKRANFGVDILPGSKEERSLCDQETVFTGRAGTGMIFDTMGIHGGGNTRQGTRRVFMVTLFDRATFL
jgi:hypothetical protein